LPVPYPLPFGSSLNSFQAMPYILYSLSALFSWLEITMVKAHLQTEVLLMGTLLDGCQIRLPALPPFIPALRIDG
jgi:hypothetical protein